MMKRLLTLTLIAATAAVAARAQSPSRIVTDTIPSEILGAAKPFSVYLPAGYDDTDKDYPVLYLLHGATDDHQSWQLKGNMRKIADVTYLSGMAVPAVIVMPDAAGEEANSRGYRMGYFNKPDWEYERHFFEEFIPAVEAKYRIRSGKQYRAVAGLSMGGGGSMVYALHHPELFSSCCPLSGLLAAPRIPDRLFDDDAFHESIERDDPQAIIRNAGPAALDSFRTVRWYIDCGDDDFLYECNVQTYLLMKEKEIPLEYRMRDGGHSWEYWQSALPTVLTFISVPFAR